MRIAPGTELNKKVVCSGRHNMKSLRIIAFSAVLTAPTSNPLLSYHRQAFTCYPERRETEREREKLTIIHVLADEREGDWGQIEILMTTVFMLQESKVRFW